MTDDRDGRDLRRELATIVALAIGGDASLVAELERRDTLHLAETSRRDELHIDEMRRREVLHSEEVGRREDRYMREIDLIRTALETRDLIGQAKGVIIGTTGCSADEAFLTLKNQSQHQNRKLVEIAAELVRTAQRPR